LTKLSDKSNFNATFYVSKFILLEEVKNEMKYKIISYGNENKTSSYPERNKDNVYTSSTYNELAFN